MFIGSLPKVASQRISEARARVLTEKDVELGRWLTPANTTAGISVTPDTAMNQWAYYSCNRVICEDLASLPLLTYLDEPDGSQTEARNTNLFWVLRDQPNDIMSPMDFYELMTNDMINCGIARARIVLDRSGDIRELRRMHPMRTRIIKLKNGKPGFEWYDESNEKVILAFDEVLKVHAPFGVSVLGYMRNTIGASLVKDQYEQKYFSNFGRPGGVITMKRNFEDDEAIKRFKKNWHDDYAGVDNAYNLAVLEEGMEWEPINTSNSDGQFLESSKLNDLRICGGMRVPPHMVGILDRATFSNIDSQQISYYQQTLRSWSVRWQQAIKRDLMMPSQQRTMSVGFDLSELLIGDFAARGLWFQSMRQNGVYSANDVRKKLKEKTIGPQGDIYVVQAGYLPANLVAQAKSLQDLQPAKAPVSGKSDPASEEKGDGK